MAQIYEFDSYHRYLIQQIGESGKRTGARTKAAEAAGISPAYLSRVLAEEADLSLEQAERFNAHFRHSKDEAHFFLLLVQKARAGSRELQAYFQEQIQRILRERENIRKRVEVEDNLSMEYQSTYYTSWVYSALHVWASLPTAASPAHAARTLGISSREASAGLEFLEKAGLVLRTETRYQMTQKRIHVGKESPLLVSHLRNWRERAKVSYEHRSAEERNIFFTSVVSLSDKDHERFRKRLLDFIQEFMKEVAASPEEKLTALNLDFFGLDREE